MPYSFAETLKKRILVFDGPMGTELYRHHIFTNRSYDELNLSNAKLIEQILTEYKESGADVLTTNTFGANRPTLEKHGIAAQLAAINEAGVKIAKKVASDDCFVAGSIGPILGCTDAVLEGYILEQVDALRQAGADFILFETLPNRQVMEAAAKAMSQRLDVPFVLSFAVNDRKESHSGDSLARMLAPLPETVLGGQLVAFGMNCGCGPEGLLAATEDAVKLTTLPLIVQPNAGLPKEFEGRYLYYSSPEYVATYAMRLANLGVAAIGGCCGITPEHIKEIAAVVKPLAKAHSARSILQDTAPEVVEKKETPLAERSRLGWKLANRQWITTIEIVPPRGFDLKDTIEKCRTLYRRSIDAVNLPDGPRASSRISSLVAAGEVLRRANIEPILHFCCRDKNLIGMQADLLGCAAMHIHNILFITGDPPKLGLYPDATGVFDTDSIGMSAVQRRLNRGVDFGGQSIEQTRAVIGVGLDPTSLDRRRELDRFKRKIDAGAEFAVTQPVFDPEALLKFLDELGDCPIPVIAGVWPLASYRNAEFMQNEVPGVIVPDSTMKRMERVSKQPKEAQLAVGVEIAREMIAAVQSRINGVQVSAPFGRIDIALNVLE